MQRNTDYINEKKKKHISDVSVQTLTTDQCYSVLNDNNKSP